MCRSTSLSKFAVKRSRVEWRLARFISPFSPISSSLPTIGKDILHPSGVTDRALCMCVRGGAKPSISQRLNTRVPRRDHRFNFRLRNDPPVPQYMGGGRDRVNKKRPGFKQGGKEVVQLCLHICTPYIHPTQGTCHGSGLT